MTKKKPNYGLERKFNKKNVREFIDFDYVAKLTPEEAEFLNKFSEEFYGNHFKNDGTDLHPQKTASRKRCYDAENARNRDTWNQRLRDDADPANRGDTEDGD